VLHIICIYRHIEREADLIKGIGSHYVGTGKLNTYRVGWYAGECGRSWFCNHDAEILFWEITGFAFSLWAGKMVQAVEHLPRKCEALNSNPMKTKKKKKKERKDKQNCTHVACWLVLCLQPGWKRKTTVSISDSNHGMSDLGHKSLNHRITGKNTWLFKFDLLKEFLLPLVTKIAHVHIR
jgi:hypothetical protein